MVARCRSRARQPATFILVMRRGFARRLSRPNTGFHPGTLSAGEGTLSLALSQGARGRAALSLTLSQGARGQEALSLALSRGARGQEALSLTPSLRGRGDGRPSP